VENVNRVLTDQIDLGFALSVSASEGATTEGGHRLRVVSPLYPNLVHILVREGSGVSRLQELAGKVVSVGSPGSGTEQTARQLLESAGLSYEDIEERYLSFTESAAALRDGALDAALGGVMLPFMKIEVERRFHTASVSLAGSSDGLLPDRTVMIASFAPPKAQLRKLMEASGFHEGGDAMVTFAVSQRTIIALGALIRT
jgi:TRAP transporter TAXI family solute receptor